MDAIINWLKGLSTWQKIALAAVLFFTPTVGIVFSIVFSGAGALAIIIKVIFVTFFKIVAFAFGFLNWKGVLFFFVIGMVFAGKRAYQFIQDNDSMDDDEEDEDFNWNSFR